MESCKIDDIEIDEYFKKGNFYEEIVKEVSFNQGDIILPYQHLIETDEYKGKEIIGIIIVTNQCDIEQGQAKYISYVPIYRTTFFIELSTNDDRDTFKTIIKQNHRTLFYLPPHPYVNDNLGGIIHFENIMTKKKELFYKKYPSPKLRLKRPFIDRLCSKIAFFFNRIPVTHPVDDKIGQWIEGNEMIESIMEMSRLQVNAQNYIKSEDINKWVKESRNLDECKEIIRKYGEAQKFIKRKEQENLEIIIKELEKFEDPNENRYIKLKENYKKLREKLKI